MKQFRLALCILCCCLCNEVARAESQALSTLPSANGVYPIVVQNVWNRNFTCTAWYTVRWYDQAASTYRDDNIRISQFFLPAGGSLQVIGQLDLRVHPGSFMSSGFADCN